MVQSMNLVDIPISTKKFHRNPAELTSPPQGYMYSDEFWAIVERDTKKFCQDINQTKERHGL